MPITCTEPVKLQSHPRQPILKEPLCKLSCVSNSKFHQEGAELLRSLLHQFEPGIATHFYLVAIKAIIAAIIAMQQIKGAQLDVLLA